MPSNHLRNFGKTGLVVPPILWSAAPQGNACRVIPDQVKLALTGEWLAHSATPPLFIEASLQHGNGLAVEMAAANLRQLDVKSQDVVVTSRLGWLASRRDPPSSRSDALSHVSSQESATLATSYEDVVTSWQQTQDAVGGSYRPQLIALDLGEPASHPSNSVPSLTDRIEQVITSYRAIIDIKSSQQIRGIGIATSDWTFAEKLRDHIPLDWIVLASCLSIRQHPQELLDFIDRLHRDEVAVVIASPFHGGFLVGGARWDDRLLDRENSYDRPHLSWRTGVAALCEGHGITPLQAAVQFDLAVPGVAAILINTSHTERVAEITQAAANPVPAAFWASMKEERLLAADCPHV